MIALPKLSAEQRDASNMTLPNRETKSRPRTPLECGCGKQVTTDGVDGVSCGALRYCPSTSRRTTWMESEWTIVWTRGYHTGSVRNLAQLSMLH